VNVAIKKVKFTTINKTYTEKVRDWRGRSCFSTQYANPDGKRIFHTYYFVKRGYTISKVFHKNGEFMYYYCDVMEMKEVAPMRYVMVDLLLDLIIYPDGRYHLIDVDEFADSVDKGHLKKRQQVHALRTLDTMLKLQTKRRLVPRFVQEAKMSAIPSKPIARK
jgi:predicted RNA-binding protein associated with RNAse of E/G family